MTRSVLVVAYYAPPAGGIASVRLAGHVRHLPEFGWAPSVLAPRDPAYFRDETLLLAEQQTIRTRSLELSRTGKRVLRTTGSDTRPAEVGQIRGAARSLARRALYFPDPQVGWLPFALHAGRRTVARQRFDAVVSSAHPITSHLIARRLARRAGVPWVAEFRDPWSALLPTGSPQRTRAARLERRLARDASAVVMTSRSWAEQHAESWMRPVSVVPNGYDPPKVASRPRVFPVLSYLGTFYPEWQDLSAVWPAVGQPADAGHGIGRIRFIGEMHPVLRDQIAGAGLSHLVEETGFLAHSEALGSLRSSQALLIAGPRDGRPILRGHVPAKVFECLGSDRPIVYVGDLGSDSAAILREHAGCHLAAPGDTGSIEAALARCGSEPVVRDLSALSRRSRASQFAAVLDAACATNGSVPT